MIHFEVELDYPGAELGANARQHWAARARNVATARYAARIDAINARIRAGLTKPLTPPVRADLVFYVTTERRRDEDNFVGRMKPLFDGLVDAKVLQDDSATKLKIGDVTFQRARKPAVVIRLSEMGGGNG